MELDRQKFNENKKIIIGIICFITLIFIISLFIKDKEVLLEEKDLDLDGIETYNKLVINEYMSSNSGTIIDEDGNSYDWVELYNGTDKDINLKNYGLSDTYNKIKWVFPDTVIKAKSYLIVYLSGTNKEGLYAPFKLKSSGNEEIILFNKNSKVVDAVKTVPLTSRQSCSRNLHGEFIITNMPTPNYANTKEGYDSLYSNLKVDNNGLKITEVLAKNDGNFVLENNLLYGYVEITNFSNENINLKNFYLSNDINKLYKYKFEDYSLKPNEAIVVYMGSSISNNYLFSNFDLNNKNGNVFLSSVEGGIIDSLTYENIANGVALEYVDGIYKETIALSPGYLNNNEGKDAFASKYLSNKKSLIINEVMNSNSSYLPQNGYNFYDWIELYNNSNEIINLKDYYLTTTINNIKMYNLPDVTLKPGEYYVIMASGNENLKTDKYYHANFKLSSVESLYLIKDKKVIDSMVIYEVPLNYSYGRGEKNGFYYFESPTPLGANKVGKREVSFAPTFSIASGVYNNIDDLTIKLEGIGDIYYTLDGSIPTNKSKKYTGEITISKTTVIRAIAYESGKIKSDVITNSYIVNENHTMSVVSLTLSPSDLTNLKKNRYSDLDYNGYVELYEESSSFSISCNISLFGGWALGINHLPFKIKFKKSSGASELIYKLFDNRDTSVYQSFLLRAGSQDAAYGAFYDSSTGTYSKGNNSYIRDVLATSLIDEYTSVDVQAYKPVVLYVNGEYYGVYTIREQITDDFIANHYNVSPDNVSIVEGHAGTTNLQAKTGTKSTYNNLYNFVKKNDMSKTENYNKVKDMLDIENYIDFWIAELYTANNDIINQRYFSHPNLNNNQIKMIAYDFDCAFYNITWSYYDRMTLGNKSFSAFLLDSTIMANLMKNQEFKKTFLERLSYNLKNTWSTETVKNKFNELKNIYYPEMERSLKKYGYTMKQWEYSLSRLESFIDKRMSYVLNATKSYFKLSNSEFEYYFGGVK